MTSFHLVVYEMKARHEEFLARSFKVDLGPELQCLLKVEEDLSEVVIFQIANNNVSN